MTNVLSAQQIRAVRLANGIRQYEFAQFIGVPRSSYSHMEAGTGKMYVEIRAKATHALKELGADFSTKDAPTEKNQRVISRSHQTKYTPRNVASKQPKETPDTVNRPDHYHKGGIDVLEYAERKLPRDQNIGFYRINVLKYVTRYDSKNGLEDLMKAQYYLDKLIKAEQQEE